MKAPSLSLAQYRGHRERMISGLRDFRVHGDLVRHCELHRDMQRGLARLRAAYSSETVQ